MSANITITEEIEKDFPFFPTLHRILATRPNVNPIVVTTALGPQGMKTVWYQPPNGSIPDDLIDPVLLAQSHTSNTPAPAPARSFGGNVTNTVAQGSQASSVVSQAPSTGGNRAPKSSTASREALESARQLISKVPKKRSLGDTMLQIQRCSSLFSFAVLLSHAVLRENLQEQRRAAHQHYIIEMRKQIMEEQKVGIWTPQQAATMIRKLMDPVVDATNSDDDNPPMRKKIRHQLSDSDNEQTPRWCRPVREPSPDWDEIVDEKSDEEESIYA